MRRCGSSRTNPKPSDIKVCDWKISFVVIWMNSILKILNNTILTSADERNIHSNDVEALCDPSDVCQP